MASHTGRLVAVIILALFAIIALMNGYWVGSAFWVLVTLAVGYPFVRGGKVDLQYDPPPMRMVIVEPRA